MDSVGNAVEEVLSRLLSMRGLPSHPYASLRDGAILAEVLLLLPTCFPTISGANLCELHPLPSANDEVQPLSHLLRSSLKTFACTVH